MRKWIITGLLLALVVTPASSQIVQFSGAALNSVPFTALHTYYISTSGSDSNNGTSPATAWATPGHSVVCGDVIIVEAGTYSSGQFGAVNGASNNWGAVSSCPSTSGGIDGAGGIYFAVALCAGPYITSCNIVGGSGDAVHIGAFGLANTPSNWAVEGMYASQNTTVNGGCYLAQSNTTNIHHIAFINDIASQCGLCGFCTNFINNAQFGVDQTAVVGDVAFNAAQSSGGGGNCGSGISIIPSGGPDTSSGTHVFLAGNFVYNNYNAPTGSVCSNTGSGTFNTDGEGIIFDSWGDGSNSAGYQYQAAIEQNAVWINGSSCIQAFPQGTSGTDRAAIYIFQNSCYGDYTDTNHFFGGAEGYLSQIHPVAGSGFYSLTNNIFLANIKQNAGTDAGNVYGVEVNCNDACANLTNVVASGNYFWNSAIPTTTTAGGSNTLAQVSGSPTSWPFGSNTYNDPGFASPTSLPSASQPPTCASYATTIACMNDPGGFNVAGHLLPSNATGLGYQKPGSCAADSKYPPWLKGINRLYWNGSALFEVGDLIIKPCGV